MAEAAKQPGVGERVAWTSRNVFLIGAVALAGTAVLAPPAAAEALTTGAVGFGLLALLSEGLRESSSNRRKQ